MGNRIQVLSSDSFFQSDASKIKGVKFSETLAFLRFIIIL